MFTLDSEGVIVGTVYDTQDAKTYQMAQSGLEFSGQISLQIVEPGSRPDLTIVEQVFGHPAEETNSHIAGALELKIGSAQYSYTVNLTKQ